MPPPAALADALALAVVESSAAPLLLLDGDCRIIAASTSFATAFDLPVEAIVGRLLYALGHGEWDLPRLRSLLAAAASGAERVPAYEIDLELPGHGRRRLVLNAHKLAYHGTPVDAEAVRLLLAVADVTDARLAERVKDDLLREKAVMMQEIQHRVANSLQIIASVLMQSARKVTSNETRLHLRDAHSRVMAIADLQHQLAESDIGDVALAAYLQQLCSSLGASMIDDHDRITLTVAVDKSRVTANASVSLGLVVTELVINALKHAFPKDRLGVILVDYAGDAAGWRLSVTDDGIGMPPAAGNPPGLGTSIVTALARHLEADVEVTDAAPGTRVQLVHHRGDRADAPEVAV
jgi:two-component sensor histidine kinase